MRTVESGYIFASARQGGIKLCAIQSVHATWKVTKEKTILYFLFIRSLKMRSYILNMLLINCLHHNPYHFVDCEPIKASMKYLALKFERFQ